MISVLSCVGMMTWLAVEVGDRLAIVSQDPVDHLLDVKAGMYSMRVRELVGNTNNFTQ